MRFAIAALIIGLAVSGCSEFPEHGFATQALGGTVIDAVPGIEPSPQSQVYTVPDPVADEGPSRPDVCTAAARGRADDTKAQGFGEDMQKRVYDATFADCAKWARRH